MKSAAVYGEHIVKKPHTTDDMAGLIRQAREKISFNLSFDGYCVGECDRCPEKLLEFLDMELSGWEARLKEGETPNLGDVHGLARSCKEVYDILEEHGFV